MLLVLETENLYVYIIILVINITMVVILTVIVITFTISFFYCFFRPMFIKSKIERLTMALSEISSDLKCFGFLNVMKAKSDALYHVFCPVVSTPYQFLYLWRFSKERPQGGSFCRTKKIDLKMANKLWAMLCKIFLHKQKPIRYGYLGAKCQDSQSRIKLFRPPR